MGKDRLFALMSDYANWPKLFPQHKAVRLIRRDGDREYLEIDNADGTKITEIHRVVLPSRIEVEEFTAGWSGLFVNEFEALPDGTTRLTIIADFSLKGPLKVFEPFSSFFKDLSNKQIKKNIHDPLKKAVTTTFAQ